LWDIVPLSLVIQWGKLSQLAQDFHRVSLAGPLNNIPTVLLAAIIVPLGFAALLTSVVWSRVALLLVKALSFCAGCAFKRRVLCPWASVIVPNPRTSDLPCGRFLRCVCLCCDAR
jgi:hypothetical protein